MEKRAWLLEKVNGEIVIFTTDYKLQTTDDLNSAVR